MMMLNTGKCAVMDRKDETAVWKNCGSRTEITNISEIGVNFIIITYNFGRTLVRET